MTTFLPPEVQAGLDDARKLAQKKSNRLHICADGKTYQVLYAWEDGFALNAATTENLRGRIELYDGVNLLSQCLIVAAELDGDDMRFEYKRMTEVTSTQPLDFYKAPNAPVALIEKH